MQTTDKSSEILFLGDWYLTSPADASSIVGCRPFIFNLEAPISRRGSPTPGKISLRMEKNEIVACFGAKPAAVCLGNNHIMDYGPEAFEDTLAELNRLNVPFFGCGYEEDNFNNPLTLSMGEHRLALMGYVCSSTHPIFPKAGHPGVCQLEINRIRADVQRAKDAGATHVVVSIHWGAEDIPLPKPTDVTLAHQLIDMGVDVIVGHHAHVPQPIERYNDKPIAYGLGNVAMDDIVVPNAWDEFGHPKRMFRKIQLPSNRTSLGLQWNVATEHWEVKEFLYCDRKVVQKTFRGDSITKKNVGSRFYGTHYNLYSRIRRIAQLYRTFRAERRFPHLHHVRSLIRILLRGIQS
ncbi:CapA family protein [Aggregatilinea lenta]|uniref:CapA family protein n=1 Tax=Aggregatilinea lenta TaxID=913108 RepID=UPI000E5A56E4|nr:CapA family protein [Aggregatilinea lenta]